MTGVDLVISLMQKSIAVYHLSHVLKGLGSMMMFVFG